MFVHFPGVQVWKHAIAEIFEDECLAAVADNDPVASADLDLRHFEMLLDSLMSNGVREALRNPQKTCRTVTRPLPDDRQASVSRSGNAPCGYCERAKPPGADLSNCRDRRRRGRATSGRPDRPVRPHSIRE